MIEIRKPAKRVEKERWLKEKQSLVVVLDDVFGSLELLLFSNFLLNCFFLFFFLFFFYFKNIIKAFSLYSHFWASPGGQKDAL